VLPGYQLIDFGNGRKLESLSGYLIDRPSPAAANAQPVLPPGRWREADATFLSPVRSGRGTPKGEAGWSFRTAWPEGLAFDAGAFRMPLRPTPFGHIGCFPEQAAHWAWLGAWLAARISAPPRAGDHPGDEAGIDSAGEPVDRSIRGLNLFAHTGGSTLAMATAGATVTHVDAAKPSVLAARAVAAENGLGEAQARFLVDDAARFVAREVRRGNGYQVIVLDPPTYGHAPDGKAWRIGRDLWPLLDDCFKLFSGEKRALLVTGHGEQPDQRQIRDYLRGKIGDWGRPRDLHWEVGRSTLRDAHGRSLDAGYFVRVATG
jgi:23S rRNA (cytosine1962-C5)-methyltransferase